MKCAPASGARQTLTLVPLDGETLARRRRHSFSTLHRLGHRSWLGLHAPGAYATGETSFVCVRSGVTRISPPAYTALTSLLVVAVCSIYCYRGSLGVGRVPARRPCACFLPPYSILGFGAEPVGCRKRERERRGKIFLYFSLIRLYYRVLLLYYYGFITVVRNRHAHGRSSPSE